MGRMKAVKRSGGRGKLLRVTALSAALMSVYGVAGAEPHMKTSNTLTCINNDCVQPDPGTHFHGDSESGEYFDWVVKAENSTLALTGGSVEGVGNKVRGVGSTAGSTVTLDGVEVSTDTGGGSNWGSHGVQAEGEGSTLHMNGGSIRTSGEYSNGMQAGAGGVITGTNVDITADGQGSHTFGVEANDGGSIQLDGGSINVVESGGSGAAGVRAYAGSRIGATAGEVILDGTSVNVTGESAIGLMAGDVSNGSETAGNITFKNSMVSVDGKDAKAAYVRYGSEIILENATLIAKNESGDATGIFADGSNSTVTARNLDIYSSGLKRAKGCSC